MQKKAIGKVGSKKNAQRKREIAETEIQNFKVP